MNEKYLKDKQYYYDLYDRFTVECCLEKEAYWQECDIDGKKLNSRGEKVARKMFSDIIIYFIKGDRRAQREETVQKWISRDEEKQERLNDFKTFNDIRCPKCSGLMELWDKEVMLNRSQDREMVLLTYSCPTCDKKRGVWEDKSDWRFINPCPKCQSQMETKREKKNKDAIITIYICPSCEHEERSVFDLKSEVKQEEDKKEFIKNKKRFCLTLEEGRKYLDSKANLERVSELIKEQKEKDKNAHIYDAINKLNKLSVAQLKDILSVEIEKNNYRNLQFKSPEMEKDVQIEFTCEDAKENRHEYDSRMQLKKIINEALKQSNWTLMSMGISYRIGILSGKLRGFDREEDLKNLVIKKQGIKPCS